MAPTAGEVPATPPSNPSPSAVPPGASALGTEVAAADEAGADATAKDRSKTDLSRSQTHVAAQAFAKAALSPTESNTGASTQDGARDSGASNREAEPVRSVGRAAAAPVFAPTGEAWSLPASNVVGPSSSVVATPALAASSEFPQQIVQAMHLQALEGGGEARVRLRPDYLGEVVIAIKVENGAVTAILQAETPEVREWAKANEPALRQSLAEQGLHLERLTVSDDVPKSESENRDPREQRRQPQARPQQQPRRPRRDDDVATFEVVV
jgi:flagellar hook-length control protein FliK